MCGIAGIISNQRGEVSLRRLKQMTDSIAHRGPDGEGQWVDETQAVGLAHRRLSIIDLSEHAGQPMHYAGRYTIVFNGEIYNYVELKKTLSDQGFKFTTNSDTEVLMALYHRDRAHCLQLLDGMFAFAIYDKEEHTVFCARDRFGEKPFHYHYEPGKLFMFGSEMKTLWAAGLSKDTDTEMLYRFFQHGLVYNPDKQEETFFKGIRKLEQAHYLLINTKSMEMVIRKYWDLDITIRGTHHFEEACKQFKSLFYTSVSRRLRSDVPVGSSLSGGLDSSAVVCAINDLNAGNSIRQKTFSARFPGFEKDEGYFQQLVIDQTKAEAFFTYPDADTMLNELDQVYFHQEEPFSSSSLLAQYEVFKLARKQNVTVLLDGQGADEFLAGYHNYYPVYFQELRHNRKEWSTQMEAYTRLHSGNHINRLFNKGLKHQVKSKLPLAFGLAKQFRTALLGDRGMLHKDFYHQHKSISNDHPVHHSLNASLKHSLLGGPLQELLRYADRNSMAHSREVRLPFLNHELVQLVMHQPSAYKINDGWTKYIMRKSMEDLLPKEITWRIDKIGYEPPQKKWLSSPRAIEMIQEHKRTLVNEKILDPSVLFKQTNKPTAPIHIDKDWRIWMAGKLFE